MRIFELVSFLAALAVAAASNTPGVPVAGAGTATDVKGQRNTLPSVINKKDAENIIGSSVAANAATQDVEKSVPVNEQFPHAVLFGRACGGSIISPTWVLTAAHCTLFTGGHSVLVGTNTTDDNSGERVPVKRLVIHPLFSVGPYWLNPDTFNIKQVAARWDFLLAELERPLQLNNKTIAAIELDDQLTLQENLDVGYAGYGAEKHGQQMRHEMHGTKMLTVADETCASLDQYNPQDMLCVKGQPPRLDTACNGDSGSGLVRARRLAGVASWVQDDARTCYPGALVVFARVAAVADWVRNVTGLPSRPQQDRGRVI